MITIKDSFDPVLFSLEENQFLLDHLGEPSVVALKEIRGVSNPNPPRDKQGRITDKNPVIYPDGVVPAAVKPVLDRVYELLDLEKNFGQKWIGVEALKGVIQTYLDQQARWISDSKRYRGAPRFPSMASYDAKNRPHLGGPGSDCGKVQTYFDATGERVRFKTDLFSDGEPGTWKPAWADRSVPEVRAAKGITVDAANHRLECPICKHTESYKEDSRASLNSARGRMKKHLQTETKEVDLHRELNTNEFGS